MLIQPTIEKLCAMRLRGMAEAFQQQQQDADIHSLSFEERFGLLIDRQWNWRQNRALDRRLRNARLQGPACIGVHDARVRILTERARARYYLTAGYTVRKERLLACPHPSMISSANDPDWKLPSPKWTISGPGPWLNVFASAANQPVVAPKQ